jgi:hypothetical protein
MKVILTLLIALLIGICANAQVEMGNPFSMAHKKTAVKSFIRSITPSAPVILNTFKANVSIPGYWYSNGQQQALIVGMGYAFEHYKNDSLIYSVGPYIWYKSSIPTGSGKLPVGYGAAFGYRGLFLLGIMAPDFVHWGPVVSTNFSFGNGGIKFGGTTL